MRNGLEKFIRDEKGATAIEYGLIAAGISVAIIAVVSNLGSTLNTTLGERFDGAEVAAGSAAATPVADRSKCNGPAQAGLLFFGVVRTPSLQGR